MHYFNCLIELKVRSVVEDLTFLKFICFRMDFSFSPHEFSIWFELGLRVDHLMCFQTNIYPKSIIFQWNWTNTTEEVSIWI